MASGERPLIGIVDDVGGLVDLGAYESHEGYAGARQALTGMTPAEVIELVKDANLRGRGGAGFPTGLKWSCVPQGEASDGGLKYLVCNGDEMEPGTFKDRYLLEYNPHLLVEGMIIGAYAIGAAQGYVFLRGEYMSRIANCKRPSTMPRPGATLARTSSAAASISTCASTGSAGRYICGEETALLNALEGQAGAAPHQATVSARQRRVGTPHHRQQRRNLLQRARHPSPRRGVVSGTGARRRCGHQALRRTGRVNKPGLWELPIGTPIREIIDVHAGGMQDGYNLRGLLPGGASTDFLVEQHFDLAMDYGTIQAPAAAWAPAP